MSDEEAKAIQEVAKATGKSVDLVRSTGRFLNDVFGEPIREFGGVLGDWAQYYRYRNRINIIDKVQAIRDKRSAIGKPVPIPPEFTLPVLEGISLESENRIQDLWAGLIANATDPIKSFRIRKVFLEILRGLEPLDARIMAYLANPELDQRYGFQTDGRLNAEELASNLEGDPEEVKLSVQTLARFGCVIDAWENTLERLDSGYSGFRVNNPASNFRLSHLGRELVKATKSSDDAPG